MSDDLYSRTDGAITATAIKAGATSMRLMQAEMTGARAREETPAMRWGSIIHAAIMEPTTFAARSTIWTGGRRAGKEWEAFKADAGGKMILTPDERFEIMAIVKLVNHHTRAMSLLASQFSEAVCRWTDPAYGRGQCRLDKSQPGAAWLELKTTAATTQGAYLSQHYRLGYDLQLGWYSIGAGAGVPCYLLVVSTTAPYDVWLYHVPQAVLEAGRVKAVDIARRYRACEAAGVFPGADNGEEELTFEPPAWAGGGGDVDLSTGTMEASEI